MARLPPPAERHRSGRPGRPSGGMAWTPPETDSPAEGVHAIRRYKSSQGDSSLSEGGRAPWTSSNLFLELERLKWHFETMHNKYVSCSLKHNRKKIAT